MSLVHIGILEDILPQRVVDLLEIDLTARLSVSDHDVVVNHRARKSTVVDGPVPESRTHNVSDPI